MNQDGADDTDRAQRCRDPLRGGRLKGTPDGILFETESG